MIVTVTVTVTVIAARTCVAARGEGEGGEYSAHEEPGSTYDRNKEEKRSAVTTTAASRVPT